jgi:hypothetical protein
MFFMVLLFIIYFNDMMTGSKVKNSIELTQKGFFIWDPQLPHFFYIAQNIRTPAVQLCQVYGMCDKL